MRAYFWLCGLMLVPACAGEDDAATTSASSAGQGGTGAVGGVGGAGGSSTSAAGGGGEAPLVPGDAQWTVELVPENVSGSRFTVLDADVADDGRVYFVTCPVCPASNGFGAVTVRDATGIETELDLDCGFDFQHVCRVVELDPDGSFERATELTIDGALAVRPLSLEASGDAVELNLSVFGNPGFSVTLGSTMSSQAGDGRLHLQLGADGDPSVSTHATDAFALDQTRQFACAAYAPGGAAAFERSFPVEADGLGGPRATAVMLGDRCLGVGSLQGPNASIDGQPFAASESQRTGFFAWLDTSGTGARQAIDANSGVSARIGAGHADGAVFFAGALAASEMTLGGTTLAFPIGSGVKEVIVQLDATGAFTQHTLLLAEGQTINNILPNISGVDADYAPDGRLMILGHARGAMSTYRETELREDYQRSIDETYFFGELDRATGDFLWVRPPFEGELVNTRVRTDGDFAIVRGFLDPDEGASVTIGGATFTTPRATLITRYHW